MSKILFITEDGTAELRHDGRTVWSSDDDPDFSEEVSDEFLGEEDLPTILDYLVNAEKLTEEEADTLECKEEGDDEEEDDDYDPDDWERDESEDDVN